MATLDLSKIRFSKMQKELPLRLKVRRKASDLGSAHKVLCLLNEKGPMQQAEVAYELGITVPACNLHFQRLAVEGLIHPVETVSTKGRPVMVWDIDKQSNFVVGISISPPYLLMGLSDFEGKLIEKDQKLVTGIEDLQQVLGLIQKFMDTVLARVHSMKGNLRYTYVGLPGSMDSSGELISAPNFPVLNGVNMEQVFQKQYHLDCYADALSYPFYYGENQNQPFNATVMTLMWDLGIGLTLGCNHRMLVWGGENRGSKKRGIWDIGHVPIVKNGRKCQCGGKGCLEAYTGGISMLQELQDSGRSDIRNLDDLIAVTKKGDSQVIEVVRRHARLLSEHLLWVIQLVGVERMIIAGPMAEIYTCYKDVFNEGLSRILTDQQIADLAITPSSDPFGKLQIGGCLMARHTFFYPDEARQYRGIDHPAVDASKK